MSRPKMIVAIVAASFLALLAGAVALLYTPDRSRADLEARYLRQPGDMRQVAGMRLHLRDAGPRDAPAIVLIHGYAASLHTWEAWAGDLARDHRVVSFDLPGHGLSDPDPGGDYSIDRSVEVLTAVLDHLGIGSAVVAGNSLGGNIAWQLAARSPGRVDRLVLLAPAGFASPDLGYGESPKAPAAMKLFQWFLPRMAVAGSLSGLYGDKTRMSPETVTRYWEMLLAPGIRRALIERWTQYVVEDPAPLLASIRAPTLLIWGRLDRMIPVANAADYQRLIPRIETVIYDDAAHVPMEEIPARSLADLRRFLEAIP